MPIRGVAALTLRLPCPSAVNTTAAANATIAPRSERKAMLVWNVTTEDALIKFPTLSWDNSTIFLNTNATLLAYRASDGHQLWNTTLAGPITDVGVRPNDSKLLYVTTVRAAAGWERGHGGGSRQQQHPRVESSCALMPTAPAHTCYPFCRSFHSLSDADVSLCCRSCRRAASCSRCPPRARARWCGPTSRRRTCPPHPQSAPTARRSSWGPAEVGRA